MAPGRGVVGVCGRMVGGYLGCVRGCLLSVGGCWESGWGWWREVGGPWGDSGGPWGDGGGLWGDGGTIQPLSPRQLHDPQLLGPGRSRGAAAAQPLPQHPPPLPPHADGYGARDGTGGRPTVSPTVPHSPVHLPLTPPSPIPLCHPSFPSIPSVPLGPPHHHTGDTSPHSVPPQATRKGPRCHLRHRGMR